MLGVTGRCVAYNQHCWWGKPPHSGLGTSKVIFALRSRYWDDDNPCNLLAWARRALLSACPSCFPVTSPLGEGRVSSLASLLNQALSPCEALETLFSFLGLLLSLICKYRSPKSGSFPAPQLGDGLESGFWWPGLRVSPSHIPTSPARHKVQLCTLSWLALCAASAQWWEVK